MNRNPWSLQNTNTIFAGALTDAFQEYAGSGNGTTGPLNLFKTGSGRLTLSGTNSYSGTTFVEAGTLQVEGVLGQGALAVANGGRLAGTGVIGGAVEIQNGGVLAPGNNGIGTLTASSSLLLAGTTVMELSKTGMVLAEDQVRNLVSVNYGGTLVVTNVGDVRTSTTLIASPSR